MISIPVDSMMLSRHSIGKQRSITMLRGMKGDMGAIALANSDLAGLKHIIL
jgi:hypothetical protein